MKNKYITYVLASALFCIANTKLATAQWAEGKCGNYDATHQLELAHPELVQQRIDYDKALIEKAKEIKAARANKSATSSPPTYTIPIVFHVLHVNGSENISDAQIIAQVARMNTDWRKLNTDITGVIPEFAGLAADVQVEFRLAQIDPNGNCTNGIDRIYTHKTFNADESSKLNQWPRNKYMNVWVVASIGLTPGVAGYALYPADVATFAYPYDGVVMLASVCNGTSRVLTHEIGHCFSLEHTFGNTNDPGVTCGDDLVDDTPITMGHPGTCDMTPVCAISTLVLPYNFSSVTTTSGTTDTAHIYANLYATFSQFTAHGVSANSSVAGQFSFTTWDTGSVALNAPSNVDQNGSYALMTGAINTTKYYEVTLTPIFGNSMTITGLNFAFQRNGTGARSYAVRSSLDGYAANLPAASSDSLIKIKGTNEFYVRYDTTANLLGSSISCGAAFKNHTGPITFRIYGWNAEDTLGSFGIDNFTFAGSSGVIENVQNYMEYATCPLMFTYGQRDRMQASLNSTISQRNDLWTPSNLAATGTDGTSVPCAPISDFYANKYSICPGGSITFTPNTHNGIPTSYKWHFVRGPLPGDTINSTVTTPTITYSTPGSYDVTLYATNAAGTGVATKHYMISVTDAYAQVSPGLTTETFDNSSFYYSHWSVSDLDNNSRTWWLTNLASFSGSQSMQMNSYYDYFNDVDQLYSPSYNLSFVTGAVMTFRCAGATKATASADLDDLLKVYVSKDCGASWLAFKTLTGTALSNNSYHPEEFIPNSPSQWALQTATIPPSYITANTRFKFEYTTGHASNDIYIDDINITGTTGINESILDESSVSLYPNPTDQTTTLAYHLTKKANVKIELVDVLGKKIMEQENNNQMEGDYAVQISKQDLHLFNGIYFVRISIDNKALTKKLIITE